MKEIDYDELTETQKGEVPMYQALSALKPLALKTCRLLVNDQGTFAGYREAEMFNGTVPMKWGKVLDPYTGIALPEQPAKARGKKQPTPAEPFTVPAPSSQATTILWVNRDAIDRCPLNPRKSFRRDRLDELKQSFKEHGFICEMSHLWVRPHPSKPGRYELIDGERRWLVIGELLTAGEFTGEVPITISNLTDAQVIEHALVNALQREELSPIEEAEGVCQLLELPGEGGTLPTAGEIAGRLGISPDRITRARKIRRLRGSLAGQALEEGRLTLDRAELLAGVGDLQKREELAMRTLQGETEVSRATLRGWIMMEAQVSLSGPEFDPTDENLVPVQMRGKDRLCGGACGERDTVKKQMAWSCPFAQMSEGSKPMCMNPSCYRLKVEEAEDKWLTANTTGDVTAIGKLASATFFDHTGRRLAAWVGLVEIADAPTEADGLKSGVKAPGSWKKLIHGQSMPLMLLRDCDGKEHLVAKRQLCMEAARANNHDIFRGSAAAATPPAEDAPPPQDRVDRAAEAVKRDQVDEAARQAAQKARDKELAKQERDSAIDSRTARGIDRGLVEGSRGMKRCSAEFWNLLFPPMLEVVHENGALGEVCQALGMSYAETLDMASGELRDWLVATISKTPEAHLPSVAIIVARQMLYFQDEAEWLKRACKFLGVDPKEVKKRAAAEYDAEKQREAVEREIAEGLNWGPEVKTKVEEFDWLTGGDCSNSNVAEIKLPKGVKHRALLATARTVKGWVCGYELQLGKSVLGQALPNRSAVTYSNAALATKTALLALQEALTEHKAPAAAIERVAAYTAHVQLPAESKGKKAAKPAKKKGKK